MSKTLCVKVKTKNNFLTYFKFIYSNINLKSTLPPYSTGCKNKNYLFFRCAKKNMWDDLKEQFDIDEEPCNFYMEYLKIMIRL